MMASFLGHMLCVMDLKRIFFGSAMNLPRFIVIALSLGQTESQVENLRLLACPFGQALSALALT